MMMKTTHLCKLQDQLETIGRHLAFRALLLVFLLPLTLLCTTHLQAQPTGSALTLDGVNDGLRIENAGSVLGLHVTDSFTIELWINPCDLAPVQSLHHLGTCNGTWSYDLLTQDGFIMWRWNQPDPTGNGMNGCFARFGLVYTEFPEIDANTWTHVALTHDAATNQVQIFIDGIAVSTRQYITGVPDGNSNPQPTFLQLQPNGYSATAITPLPPTTDNLNRLIGINNNGGLDFRGKIAEFRFNDRVLTQAQIQADILTPAASIGNQWLRIYYAMTPPTFPFSGGVGNLGTNPGMVGTLLDGATLGLAQDFAISADVTPISCQANDGAIDMHVPPGGNYVFRWTQLGGTYTATTEDVTGLTAGIYKFNVIDLNQNLPAVAGCVANATFYVKLEAAPLTLDGTVQHPSSCSACDGTIDATETGGAPPLTFSWSDIGIGSEDRTGLCAGTYTLHATDANGCTATQTFLLDGVGDCCPAATDPNYAAPPASIVSTTQSWSGKIYVDQDIIVDNGATLDLTNVDLVFASCVGMDFVNGATLIANNSVFRACESAGGWRGLSFDQSEGNQINECIIQQAEAGVTLLRHATAAISSCTFHNNYVGVDMRRVQKPSFGDLPISGNRFVVDQLKPDFSNCQHADAFNAYGVRVRSCKLTSPLSQNEFIYQVDDDRQSFIGIVLQASRANASGNAFTNCTSAIEVVNALDQTTVENNVVQITEGRGNFDPQIYVHANGAPAYIFGNTLTNSNVYDGLPAPAAIHVKSSQNVGLVGNQITGFETGIELFSTHRSAVIENSIRNARSYGIYISNDTRQKVDVTCNEIDLDNLADGTGIYARNVRRNASIHSNCISDCAVAIDLVYNAASPNNGLPTIKNNWLYNYSLFGLYIDGYNGTIGTAAEPGKNTFWSNASGSVDISSTAPVSVADNYGLVAFTPATVNITHAAETYSTAACAAQFHEDNHQGSLDVDLHCRDFSASPQSPLFFVANGYTLPQDYASRLLKAYDAGNLEAGEAFVLVRTIHHLLLEDNEPAATAFAERMVAEGVGGQSMELWLQYDAAMAEGNTVLAAAKLELMAPNEQLELDRKFFAQLDLRSTASVDDSELSHLVALATDDGFWANNARVALRNTVGSHAYVFDRPEERKHRTAAGKVARLDAASLTVFPNPATNRLSISLASAESDNHEVRVYDLAGKVLIAEPLGIVAGQTSVDVSTLTSGLYIVAVTSSDGSTTQTRFVKQ